jgi:ABC-type transporter Mla subunit MlaD
MENWQVVLVVLASVLVGALIPAIAMLSVALYRAAREVAATGKLLAPTLVKVQAISDRVETLSRGLEGGEKSVAELLSVAGDMARSLDRNMKMINVASTVLAAAVPAVAAFVQTMRGTDPSPGHAPGKADGA